MASTRTRYARCGDVDIAYQVLGDGPLDLLLFTGAIVPVECLDEEPSMARFQRRLASFGRLIRFDQRGVGLSDRGSPAHPPTHEQWVDDATAVLDAVGTEHAAVVAPFMSAAEGIALAATLPDRVSSLVVLNGSARLLSAPDYPTGTPQAAVELLWPVLDPDAVEQGFDALGMIAPSARSDPDFRAWFDRAGNLGAAPAMAQAHWVTVFTTDVRHLLAEVRVPTLILHRTDITAPYLGVGHGRYLAAHIAGAKYVELDGTDALYWVGDTRQMLDEIEEFVTGVRGGAGCRT